MERHQSKSPAKESPCEEHTPDMFVCPISKSLMRDPVVVVETGQVYDNVSILRWFRAGNNTCPLTGIALTSLKWTRLPSLRTAISAWANEHGMCLEPPDMLDPEQKEFGELDNPSESFPLVTAQGVSVYDPEAVIRLMSRGNVRETYAALVVLRELVQHTDEHQFKQIKDQIDIDLLKNLLNEDGLKKPAARLLVTLKGSLDKDEMTALLPIPDIDLQIELMTRLVVEICQRRSSINDRRFPHLAADSLFGRLRRFCSFPRRCFSSRW